MFEAPAKCELRVVIRLLLAGVHSAAEIHRRMCDIHGNDLMSDGCVREWCRKFKDVHDEGCQGMKSVATADIVEEVNEVVRERLYIFPAVF